MKYQCYQQLWRYKKMDYIKYIPNEMKGIKEYNELDKTVNPTISSVKSDMISISNNH